MSLAQRLDRLETASAEVAYRQLAERLAGELGVPAERLFSELIEMTERIERWGLDEELRLIARERGWTEEESQQYFEEALATASKDNED